MCHACLSMDCMSHACLSMLVIVFVWIACVTVVFAIMHCPSMSACVVLTSLATLLADAIGCAVYRGPQWGQHLGEKSHVCHIVGFANQPYVAYTHAASKCGCYILLPPIMPTFLAFAASSQSLRPPPPSVTAHVRSGAAMAKARHGMDASSAQWACAVAAMEGGG